MKRCKKKGSFRHRGWQYRLHSNPSFRVDFNYFPRLEQLKLTFSVLPHYGVQLLFVAVFLFTGNGPQAAKAGGDHTEKRAICFVAEGGWSNCQKKSNMSARRLCVWTHTGSGRTRKPHYCQITRISMLAGCVLNVKALKT